MKRTLGHLFMSMRLLCVGAWSTAVQAVTSNNHLLGVATPAARLSVIIRKHFWQPLGTSLLTVVLVSTACGTTSSVSSSTNNGLDVFSVIQPSKMTDLIFSSVSCSSPTVCMAVGTTGGSGPVVVLTSDGHQWLREPSLPGSFLSASVSCPSSVMCVVVATGVEDGVTGSRGYAFVFNDHRVVSKTVLPAGDYGIITGTVVSCTSVTFCLAVETTSNQIVAVSFNGTNWGASTHVTATLMLPSLYCSTPRLCVVTGFDSATHEGMLFRYNGRNWVSSTVSEYHRIVEPRAVVCSTVHFCLVGGNLLSSSKQGLAYPGPANAGPSVTYFNLANRHITPVAMPAVSSQLPADSPLAVSGISCTIPNNCIAVVSQRIGTTWRDALVVLGHHSRPQLRWLSSRYDIGPFPAMSCSKNFCALVGGAYALITRLAVS